MVRRSFRFGLRLGLLGGAGFAVLKVLQARREEREQEAALRSTEPWPPITRAPAPPTGEAVETAPRTTAAAPPAEEAEPEASWWIAPLVSTEGGGMVVGGRF